MTKKISIKTLGIIITKTFSTSNMVQNSLKIGNQAISRGQKVAIFLLSDGILLAKKNQINSATDILKTLLSKKVSVRVSLHHIKGAGFTEDDLWDGIVITDKTYHELVENVMEHWDRVIVI